jgi:sugar lactone lactonase YvrE
MSFGAGRGLGGMPELEVLIDGLAMGESPRWHEGRLWVCDWVAGEILAVDPGDGSPEVVLDGIAGLPFCIDWLPDGELLVVDGPSARVLRRSGEAYADLSGVSDRPWNEIAVDGRGRAYVNGIGFDLMGGESDDASGLIALVSPDGAVRQIADGLEFPNGMAVTADGSTLIVAESYAGRLTAFSIGADGSLEDRRVWAAVEGSAPDGICLDAEGAAWYADVPNKRCVRVRERGDILDTVDLDRGAFSCALGGPDGRTLFIVAAEWNGPASMAGGERTGQVLTCPAPAPGIRYRP